MQNILTNLVRVQHERYGSDREAFSRVDVAGKKCISTTWGEFRRDVDNMACALEILGLQPGDMMCVLSPNSPEILITDFACYSNRAVPVSIYATSSPEQIKYIIKDAGAHFIMVGTHSLY